MATGSSTHDDGTDLFKNWVKSIQKKLGGLDATRPPNKTIYKVPAERKASQNIYSPRFISIGPIHGNRPDLDLAMEEMKLRYTAFFLFRSKNPKKTLKHCSKAIMELQVDARKCYAPHIEEKQWNEYQLAEVLLVDGCFILELFLRRSGQLNYPFLESAAGTHDHDDITDLTKDPLLNNDWKRHVVCQDLALIENQIPFMVLESLCVQIKKTTTEDTKNENLVTSTTFSLTTDSVLDFFSSAAALSPSPTTLSSSSSRTNEISISIKKEEHFLEILHDSLLPWLLDNGMKLCRLKYSATKLLEAGVDIIKKADRDHQADEQVADSFERDSLKIVFDEAKGVLKIPQFWIGGLSSSITRNLLVLERCCFQKSHHVTAYVMFMKSLICSKEDVQLLERKGVIKLTDGSSHPNVMEFFNASCKYVTPKDFYFSKVCEDVETYLKSWRHIHRCRTWARNRRRKYVAVVKKRYCPDACRTIAFLAAAILLVFTGLQTFYTVYPYYHHQ